MGKVLRLFDRLSNVMSGMGTTADKRTASFYAFVPMTGAEAEAAYRTSWLARKIVDIPPFDMTREWRDWQAKDTDIEAIEKEETRLQLRHKVQRALVLARLFGGGALVLGVKNSGTADKELDPEKVTKDGLAYVHVMSRHQLSEGQPRQDPEDPWFGQPDYFTINGANGQTLKLHPSRIVAFVGQRRPEGSVYPSDSWFWGDPIMQSIGEAVRNADLAQGGFASLIDEAKIDIIKIPELMSTWATAEHEGVLMQRLAAAMLGKSSYRALILDGAEEWDQKEVTWAGIPEVMTAFLNVCAGAADIPLTRLLGTSPKGLQSNGDGEERDYNSMVRARQNELLAPALDRIDPLLIRSALGDKPDDVYYEFAPLSVLNEKDAAEVESKYANAFKTRMDTGAIPDDALAEAEVNRMVESGRYPGLETAIEESKKELGKDDETEAKETELQTLRQQVGGMQKRGMVTKQQANDLITDAEPRTLYVSRKVVNTSEIKAWAKKQGIADVSDDLHVTLVYSRTPIDWIKAGNPSEWSSEKDGKLTIPPGGPRVVEPLGDQTAVLMFASSDLSWRHRSIVEAGASHDYDDYIPHVSLTAAPVDLSAVEPYRGKIVLGPEIFEEVKSEQP